MMASLRARLLATLLALTAIGLLLLGGITYAEQRSFLYDRADDQLRAAIPQVVHELTDGDRDRYMPRGGGPGGGPDFGPPAGTYGQLRDASGQVVADHTFRYGSTDAESEETTAAEPKIPRRLPAAGTIVTVPAAGESGTSFRLMVQRDPFSGARLIVATPLGEATQIIDLTIASGSCTPGNAAHSISGSLP